MKTDILWAKTSRTQRFLAFPITRIALYLLLTFAILTALALSLRGVLQLLPPRHGHDWELLTITGEGLGAGSAALAFWIMVRFVDQRPWATAGFTRDGLFRGLLAGAVIGAAMLTVGVGALRLLGVYHVTAVGVLPLTPLLLYLAVAVFEETLFRGYLFQTLQGRWGSGVALGASSLLFGLAHLANPVPGAAHGARLVGPLFLCLEAGLPLGAAFLLTRKLWLSIGIHWGWDYCEGPVYGCPDSGVHDPHTLLRTYFSGPPWATGGPFGPEAGIIFLLVGTLTGLLLLRAAVRRGRWQPKPRRAS